MRVKQKIPLSRKLYGFYFATDYSHKDTRAPDKIKVSLLKPHRILHRLHRQPYIQHHAANYILPGLINTFFLKIL